MKKNARKTAEQFSEDIFKEKILKFVDKVSKKNNSAPLV